MVSILLVEDNFKVRHYYGSILTELNYKTFVESSLGGAMTVLNDKKNDISLVLLDYGGVCDNGKEPMAKIFIEECKNNGICIYSFSAIEKSFEVIDTNKYVKDDPKLRKGDSFDPNHLATLI